MNEFWMWFTRPLAEFAGALALLVGLFLLAFAGLLAVGVYHWVRRKIQDVWSGGEK